LRLFDVALDAFLGSLGAAQHGFQIAGDVGQFVEFVAVEQVGGGDGLKVGAHAGVNDGPGRFLLFEQEHDGLARLEQGAEPVGQFEGDAFGGAGRVLERLLEFRLPQGQEAFGGEDSMATSPKCSPIWNSRFETSLL
jgi:hypothetical protein